MLIVKTASGNTYHLSPWGDDYLWSCSQPRSRDPHANANGITCDKPVLGRSMLLYWHHHGRGVQERTTSTVIEIQEVDAMWDYHDDETGFSLPWFFVALGLLAAFIFTAWIFFKP